MTPSELYVQPLWDQDKMFDYRIMDVLLTHPSCLPPMRCDLSPILNGSFSISELQSAMFSGRVKVDCSVGLGKSCCFADGSSQGLLEDFTLLGIVIGWKENMKSSFAPNNERRARLARRCYFFDSSRS